MLGRLWGQLRATLFLSDEEMVKKDDDHHKAGPSVLRNAHWQPAAPVPTRRAFRRGIVVALALVGAWILMSYVSIDLGFDTSNTASRYSYLKDHAQNEPPHDSHGWPKRPGSESGSRGTECANSGGEASERRFDGPIKFHELAATLRALTGTKGGLPRNKNVLFMASSLQSAATLLPMACDMGRELRNYVHFALISRDPISIKDLARINGIDDSCQLFFHDARPDYVDIATDARMHHATTRAIFHIQNYMHPQVAIVDASPQEETWFLRGTRRQADFMGLPIIEVPEGGAKQLSWVQKLDSASLAAWDKVTIDLVVRAPSSGAGSLLRLLKSLSKMDFSGSTIPHLTIELPATVEPSVQRFLEQFHWPPPSAPNTQSAQMLSLRRRITRGHLTEEESSARFLESFWPRALPYSHVLVLTPQAELTPHFFHYLKFSALRYFHSRLAATESWPQRLLGISMSIPRQNLEGNGALQVPNSNGGQASQASRKSGEASFLWQAPNSEAMMFSGERWVELQGLVARSLESQRGENLPQMLTEKLVSKQHPAWLEHALRLARARGYLTLYPDPGTAATLGTVHDDLSQPPDEYEKDLGSAPKFDLVDEAAAHEVAPTPLLGIMNTLPDSGELPPLSALPILAWDGSETTLGDLDRHSLQYMIEWRQMVGGCEADDTDSLSSSPTAKDLFCN